MAQLYGLANYLVSELAMKLMLHNDFNKFVYYKEVDKDGDSILDMPDLENPIETLRGNGNPQDCQVWLHRRPDKILHHQDINIFIYFDDQKNYNANSKRVKTVFLKIGVLIHDKCKDTPNGARDICIISAIENALDGAKLIKGLGKSKVDRVNPLYGLPVEYSGHDVLIEIDGFKANCGETFDVDGVDNV